MKTSVGDTVGSGEAYLSILRIDGCGFVHTQVSVGLDETQENVRIDGEFRGVFAEKRRRRSTVAKSLREGVAHELDFELR